MAADTSQFEELGRLIAALLDGGLEAAERRRLEDMLLSDPAAVAYYQDYLDVHVLLHWQQGLAEEQPACGGSGTRDEGRVAEGLSPASAASGRLIHRTSYILHPFAALESLAGSAVLSYLVAVVLLGAGVLLAGAWQTGIDRSSLARAKAEAAKGTIGAPVFVARITKAQDCYREDGGPWDADGLLCRLGFQCYVKAGELEITYNTGTKVTLQGPAVYEVSAPDGGSLFEGSAAISVAHKGALPVKEAATAKEIASHPLFKLRAPVGLLTNQAAEFSLTVDEAGALFAKVKRGQVALQMPGWGPDEAVAIGKDRSAVTFIVPHSTGGFQWELHLSDDDAPLIVDSNPQRPNRSPLVLRGEQRGSLGRWGLEKRPIRGSGS